MGEAKLERFGKCDLTDWTLDAIDNCSINEIFDNAVRKAAAEALDIVMSDNSYQDLGITIPDTENNLEIILFTGVNDGDHCAFSEGFKFDLFEAVFADIESYESDELRMVSAALKKLAANVDEYIKSGN